MPANELAGRRPAGLLVSVRSAAEAAAAVAGGASVIDIKEPRHGPLGCAAASVWQEVRRVVPVARPVSVALGELREWSAGRSLPPEDAFSGVAYRKLGLAGAGPGWTRDWKNVRDRFGPGAGAAWIAVAYLDWHAAAAPHPDAVRDAALEIGDCAGILLDTFDKTRPGPLAVGDAWQRWFATVRRQRPDLLIAVAGGLDAAAIARLAPLEPDLFAVRGAACAGGDRQATIDRALVAGLVRAIAVNWPARTAPHPR